MSDSRGDYVTILLDRAMSERVSIHLLSDSVVGIDLGAGDTIRFAGPDAVEWVEKLLNRLRFQLAEQVLRAEQ